MLEAIMNPGTMTQQHWMIIGILFFIVIGILYFVYKTYQVIRDSMNNKYTPNIGLSRDKEPGTRESAEQTEQADKKEG